MAAARPSLRARRLLVCALLLATGRAAGHERERGVLGWVDSTGSVVIRDPRLHDAGDFSGGLARVRLHVGTDARWGFIDRSGRLAIPPEWERAGDFSEGLAPVARSGEWHLIDRSGATRARLRAERVHELSEGWAAYRREGAWGYVDREGRAVVPPRFEACGPRREDRARVVVDGLTGWLDAGTGRLAIPPRFEAGGDFHEGLARVRVDGRVGYVDRTGRLAIGPLPGVARAFDLRSGRARVRIGRGWGFLDRRGRLAIPARYVAATDFRDGVAAARTDAGWELIDPDGACLARFDGDWALAPRGPLAPVQSARGVGYVDRSGRTVIAPVFLRAFPFAEGLGRVELAEPRLAADGSGACAARSREGTRGGTKP